MPFLTTTLVVGGLKVLAAKGIIAKGTVVTAKVGFSSAKAVNIGKFTKKGLDKIWKHRDAIQSNAQATVDKTQGSLSQLGTDDDEMFNISEYIVETVTGGFS